MTLAVPRQPTMFNGITVRLCPHSYLHQRDPARETRLKAGGQSMIGRSIVNILLASILIGCGATDGEQLLAADEDPPTLEGEQPFRAVDDTSRAQEAITEEQTSLTDHSPRAEEIANMVVEYIRGEHSLGKRACVRLEQDRSDRAAFAAAASDIYTYRTGSNLSGDDRRRATDRLIEMVRELKIRAYGLPGTRLTCFRLSPTMLQQ